MVDDILFDFLHMEAVDLLVGDKDQPNENNVMKLICKSYIEL